MASIGSIRDSEEACSAPPAGSRSYSSLLARIGCWTGRTIFVLLVFFAVALPHSIKGAQHAWKLAFVLWLVQLLIDRRRPLPQTLSAPLLAYISLSGISTALSADPLLSWDRMKIVCLVLVGVLFAQNLKQLRQLKILVFVLLASALAAAIFTGWQYTYGIGVQITQLPAASPLSVAGLRAKDIITAVNQHSVHSPEDLRKQLRELRTGGQLELTLVRGYPLAQTIVNVPNDAFANSGSGAEQILLSRGKPMRAQGHLGHYVVFAEMLMQLACMAWAVLLSTPRKNRRWQVFSAIVFASVTVALMFTETRAAMGGLAAGCFISMLLLTSPRSRKWAASAVLVLVLMAAIWTQYVRHVKWIDWNDTGTHFRVLMWEDGLRLIGEHPWFGIGMESVRTYWRQWNIRGFAQYHVVSHFHNSVLQIAVDRGLTTLAAWLWFVAAYFVFLIRLIGRARKKNLALAGIAAGALAGFVAFQVTSLVHYNLGEEPLVTILFFYFGLAIAADRILEDGSAPDLG